MTTPNKAYRIAQLERAAEAALTTANAAATVQLACVALAKQTTDRVQADHYHRVAESQARLVQEFCATAVEASNQMEEIRRDT